MGAVTPDGGHQHGEGAERHGQYDERDRLEDQVGAPAAGRRGVRAEADGHQLYSSRKRARSQLLSRLSANVIRKSSMPTAKMVRYSSVPCGVSPRLTCTM